MEGANSSTVANSIQFMNQDLRLFWVTSWRAIPREKPDDSDELKQKRRKRKEADYLCCGHILNALGNSVYNAHWNIVTAKELWTALDLKYRIKEASNQKFLISNFMEFKISY
ncbi:hypothetical protein Q3G72_034948 [Acer saccharum]|nr:hypothetical protein Q3G72_034948 [Acer saccharum]